ncbi:PAS domain-containing sensor histidine kinase [Trichocoleus sp. FACHB-90]|uniref:PAS domain-containing sensor histidine kinase n=1 Tax=Cyanophyceae TaxID=3028117 RepID=UPI001683156E|nr:PAS domain-containing protein [Trichocoleus sp. FACHB-90]MBD1928936.1 PAS domain-containing sensor histidine kinase [Trichocoleus sp. FACHB-90]
MTNLTNELLHPKKLKGEIIAPKETEALSPEDKERLELAVTGSKDGVWDWNLETNQVFFSASWKRMLGFLEHEFPNNFDEWKKSLHPDDCERVLGTLQAHLDGINPYYESEHRLRHKDGSYRWVISRGSLFRDALGKPYRIAGLNTEITSRKHSEQALRESQKQLQDIIDNSTAVIYVKDTEGKYTLINSRFETLSNITREQIKGKTDYNIIDKEAADIVTANDQEVLKAGSEISWEENIIHEDGLHTYISLKFPLYDSAGFAYAVCGISTDITERKLAEEAMQKSESQLREKTNQLEQTLQKLQHTQGQLIQTEKMSSLGQLVAGVAHEVNNPVNFIYGNLVHANQYAQDLLNLLQLYAKHYPHPVPEIQEEIEIIDLEFLMEDLPKMLSSMKMGADRIRQIVLSLRNFSRLDEAEMKIVDIHEGLDSTLLILQNRLKEKAGHPAIQVIKEYGNLPSIDCYAGQMNQVFMNILNNAIDAVEASVVSCQSSSKEQRTTDSRQPPTIWIQTEVLNAERVVIKIKDNGLGMTEDVRNRLFDPFFTTKPVGQGTGLGLSISYQIVIEKHGGVLKCFSEPEQGTEFWIEIPVRCSQ